MQHPVILNTSPHATQKPPPHTKPSTQDSDTETHSSLNSIWFCLLHQCLYYYYHINKNGFLGMEERKKRLRGSKIMKKAQEIVFQDYQRMNLCPWSFWVHRLYPVWLTEKKAYANWAIWRNVGLQPNMVMMVSIVRFRCTSDVKWVPSGATLNLWHTYCVSSCDDIMNLNTSYYLDYLNYAI